MIVVSPEISMASFSLIGILTGYIWNNQSKRIAKLEREHGLCPFPEMKSDIAQMKTDIDWIKKYLIKN